MMMLVMYAALCRQFTILQRRLPVSVADTSLQPVKIGARCPSGVRPANHKKQ
jgi:hypothetical protein